MVRKPKVFMSRRDAWEKDFRAMHTQGRSAVYMGKAVGVTPQTIYLWLRHYGLTCPTNRCSRRALSRKTTARKKREVVHRVPDQAQLKPLTMKPCYEPKTPAQKMGYLIEEAGEVLAAAGKTLRWGPQSVNPELPREKQVTNRDWLLSEMLDLECAIRLVRADLLSRTTRTD